MQAHLCASSLIALLEGRQCRFPSLNVLPVLLRVTLEFLDDFVTSFLPFINKRGSFRMLDLHYFEIVAEILVERVNLSILFALDKLLLPMLSHCSGLLKVSPTSRR